MALISSILYVNDDNFQQEVIENLQNALVIFEKNSWGAAHLMNPVLNKIANEYDSQLKIFRYNLEENNLISNSYNINDSFTILFVKNGEIVGKEGVISANEIKQIIDKTIME